MAREQPAPAGAVTRRDAPCSAGPPGRHTTGNMLILFIAILSCFSDAVNGMHPLNSMPNIPSEFKCPISLELMKDPVVASDGCTYERDSIQKWLAEHNTSPATNEPLQSRLLFQNRALRNLMCESKSVAAVCKVLKHSGTYHNSRLMRFFSILKYTQPIVGMFYRMEIPLSSRVCQIMTNSITGIDQDLICNGEICSNAPICRLTETAS